MPRARSSMLEPTTNAPAVRPVGARERHPAATVVHYVDADFFGGVEQVVLTLLNGLDRERFQPLLYTHGGAGLQRLLDGARQAGVECRTIASPRGLGDWRALRSFAAQLRADRVSIFHAHLNSPLACRHGLVAARIARVLHTVATAHLYAPPEGVRFMKVKQRIQRAAIDRYIAVSARIATHLEDDLAVRTQNVHVVHNGIDTSVPPRRAYARDVVSSLGGDRRPMVLTVARLHEQKGIDDLMDAAASIPDAVFVLAGEGPQRAQLQAKVARLGIQDRVRFLGHVDNVGEWLARCDVFVLPSLYEGLPLGLLEAMAAGKPVVATAIPGTDEVMTDEETGLLVAPRHPAALAAGIRRLLDEPAVAARWAARGRARVVERFSATAMVGGVQAVYDDVLRGSR